MAVKKKTPVVNTDPFVSLAKDAFDASTDYIDQNVRKDWDQSIRAFNSQHPAGSKYHHASYKYRSKLYRPKTRSTIRRAEAASVAAFFGTKDLVEIEAVNTNDPQARGAAQVNHYLLNHRLEKTIPWFQTCVGAIQDAATMGACVSFQHWKYLKDGNGKVISDKPEILLRPIENVRWDPNAEWTDPVNTSPYWIDLIPLYANDVLHMMKMLDPKTGQPRWKQYSHSEIIATQTHDYDSTRTARHGNKQDPTETRDSLKHFDIVWVHRNIIRQHGQDFFYYTLGTEKLLSEPVWIEDVYHHGERPYVMGQVILETHKTHPNGIPGISKDVQKEANEIQNSRMDNVKLVLNKRYFVKRGREVDLASLVRNAAGSATLMTDVDGDVRVVDTPDVTGSSYAEQDRINLDFDDLVGSFSTGTVQSNRSLNETVGGLNLLRGEAGTMTGYMLKTFAETWIQPVLRQLVKLEQEYETDLTVLALAAESADAFQKYGASPMMDRVLDEELTLTVNVGMTATDPGARLQQLILTTKEFVGIAQNNPGMDLKALADEMYGKIGYRDSSRFWPADGPTPEVQQLQQQVQQLQQEVENQIGKIQAEGQVKLQLEKLNEEGENQRKVAEIEYKKQSDQLDAQVKSAEQEVKKIVAQIQAQAQIQVANINSQDKTKDRVANRISEVEVLQREDNEKDNDRKLELAKTVDVDAVSSLVDNIEKLSEGIEKVKESVSGKEKKQSAIIEYLMENGSDGVKNVVRKISEGT